MVELTLPKKLKALKPYDVKKRFFSPTPYNIFATLKTNLWAKKKHQYEKHPMG